MILLSHQVTMSPSHQVNMSFIDLVAQRLGDFYFAAIISISTNTSLGRVLTAKAALAGGF